MFANSLGLVSARLVSVGLVSVGLVSAGLVSAGLVPWPLHHQWDKSQKSFSLFSPDLRSDFKSG